MTKTDQAAADRIIRAACREALAAIRAGADRETAAKPLEVAGEAAAMLLGRGAA